MNELPRSFEAMALPHLDAAFNYARWLTGNAHDAEDVVQEAFLRALQYFRTLKNDDARAWLFAIVRNTFHSRPRPHAVSFDPELHDRGADDSNPESLLLARSREAIVRSAVEALPVDFREALVLREFEGLSYKEIAAVTRVPIGTVMSRLARARERVSVHLTATRNAGGERGLF